MKVLTLPKESRILVGLCLVVQAFAVYQVATHPGLSFLMTIAAFFIATYIADLITAIFHFGFDYIWEADTPFVGPISVEFRQHHDKPMLDPSAYVSNFTRGAYMGIPFGLIAYFGAKNHDGGQLQYLYVASVLGISLWGLGFHQIHSYTHMGKSVPPDEFNAAVARISQLPEKEQKKEFAKLFERVGIPKFVRLMQKCRLFLRPEVHWRHHNSYETDFSSLNGWSDPLTNILFRPIARRRKPETWSLDAQTTK